MNLFLDYFLLFLIYSILGWIMESTYICLVNKKFVDRGFLMGSYCPIYGFGALIVILYLTQYKDNILTVFVMSMVLCSVLEYITSYLLEKIFKARWWDYSNRNLNLNGRICGYNSLLFGIASTFVLYVINPIITSLTKHIDTNVLFIISIIGLIIFTIDTIISCKIIRKLKNTINNLEKRDSTAEITKLVKEKLKKNHNIFQHRVISAFPHINLEALINKNKIKELLNSKK